MRNLPRMRVVPRMNLIYFNTQTTDASCVNETHIFVSQGRICPCLLCSCSSCVKIQDILNTEVLLFNKLCSGGSGDRQSGIQVQCCFQVRRPLYQTLLVLP